MGKVRSVYWSIEYRSSLPRMTWSVDLATMDRCSAAEATRRPGFISAALAATAALIEDGAWQNRVFHLFECVVRSYGAWQNSVFHVCDCVVWGLAN